MGPRKFQEKSAVSEILFHLARLDSTNWLVLVVFRGFCFGCATLGCKGL